jgi:tetratricopeptide (TPR) repeat protein
MSYKHLRCLPAALLLGALASGCATERGQVESSSAPVPPSAMPAPAPGNAVPGVGAYIPPSVAQPPVTPVYPKTIQDSGASGAVLSLYRQAQEARAAGHPDQAEAFLERALHIESRNPFVWQALAGARMDLKHPDEAESAAQKSNSLARGNPYVEAGNWRLIAATRQARGDASGAVQAQARADDIAQALSKVP